MEENKKRNKKIWIIVACIVLAVALILACVSCAAGGNEEDPDPTGDTSTASPTGETPDDSSTPADGTEAPAAPSEDTTEPSENETTGESTDTPSDPGVEVTDPTEKPANPTEKPTDAPTEPVQKPTDPVHSHKYTEKVVKATCTAEGYSVYTCSCGDTYRDKYTPAIGHSWGSWVTTREPTTTAKGREERKCARCKMVDGRDIPKVVEGHTHQFSFAYSVGDATCTHEAYKVYLCACGETESKVVPATGHNYKETVKKPTCTAKGYTTHTCTVCGDSYKDSYVDAKGHSYTTSVKAATCTAEGYTAYRCSGCGDSYTGNKTAALGHNYQQTAYTAPTCTAKGSRTETCSRCSAARSEEIPALGHSYQQTAYTAPTCTAKGSRTETCSRCSDKRTSEVATVSHSWVHYHKDEEGYWEKTVLCGCGWKATESEAKANGWNEPLCKYHYMFHVKQLPADDNGVHSYTYTGTWIVTVPAEDYDYCEHCSTRK